MNITTSNIPDISDYMQYMTSIQISNDISVIIIFKTLFRSDDVLVDIYLNEISDNTKIIAGRRLSENAIITLPKTDIGFNYWVYCIDQNGVNSSINKYNAYKFFLQFSDESE